MSFMSANSFYKFLAHNPRIFNGNTCQTEGEVIITKIMKIIAKILLNLKKNEKK